MLRSPLVAELCKYQVYIQYVYYSMSTAVHRATEILLKTVQVFFSEIYMQIGTPPPPFSVSGSHHYILKHYALCFDLNRVFLAMS